MHPSPQLLDLSKQAVERVFKFHGTPAGSLSSDEYIGGLSPERGAELCCTVELMFSLSYLHRLYGDNDFADRMEMAAFNFPAGIEDDWWSHQYITQTNQPWAQELELEEGEKTPWFDVCRYANVFGLEPEFVSVSLVVLLPWGLMELSRKAVLYRQPSNRLSEDAHECVPAISFRAAGGNN